MKNKICDIVERWIYKMKIRILDTCPITEKSFQILLKSFSEFCCEFATLTYFFTFVKIAKRCVVRNKVKKQTQLK